MARILIIEDNGPNMELMTYLLHAFGHSTVEARDGLTGLEMARRELPDLIVCDVQLPLLDGHQVVREAKLDQVLRHTPIIAVTAFAMVGDRARLLNEGFDGYISKPLAPETFVAQIESYLVTPSFEATREGAGQSAVE